MSYTPGLWKFNGNRRIIDQWGNTLAKAFTVVFDSELFPDVKREITSEEQEANARLIALAPELAAMLKLAQETICLYHCQAVSRKDKGHVKICREAREVLARLEKDE